MPERPRVDPSLHLDVAGWLAWEAELLDEHRYRDWLELLTDDVTYRMPVQVTRAAGANGTGTPGMVHFDEDRYMLGLRVARFEGRHAWTEDPPSRTRRFVTNVRVSPASDGAEEVEVGSYLLVFRSRGDMRDADLISAARHDVVRRPGRAAGDWRLARRHITVDEAVLHTQNLAIFL